jgi:hypothetical protein
LTSGTETVPAPLVRLERRRPVESTTSEPTLQPVVIEVYHAALVGAPQAYDDAAGLLWLPQEALRQVVHGLPLGTLLSLQGVRARLATEMTWPEDALVYLPAEYGERFLLRVAAKYGRHTLFEGGDDGIRV